WLPPMWKVATFLLPTGRHAPPTDPPAAATSHFLAARDSGFALGGRVLRRFQRGGTRLRSGPPALILFSYCFFNSVRHRLLGLSNNKRICMRWRTQNAAVIRCSSGVSPARFES